MYTQNQIKEHNKFLSKVQTLKHRIVTNRLNEEEEINKEPLKKQHLLVGKLEYICLHHKRLLSQYYQQKSPHEYRSGSIEEKIHQHTLSDEDKDHLDILSTHHKIILCRYLIKLKELFSTIPKKSPCPLEAKLADLVRRQYDEIRKFLKKKYCIAFRPIEDKRNDNCNKLFDQYAKKICNFTEKLNRKIQHDQAMIGRYSQQEEDAITEIKKKYTRKIKKVQPSNNPRSRANQKKIKSLNNKKNETIIKQKKQKETNIQPHKKHINNLNSYHKRVDNLLSAIGEETISSRSFSADDKLKQDHYIQQEEQYVKSIINLDLDNKIKTLLLKWKKNIDTQSQKLDTRITLLKTQQRLLNRKVSYHSKQTENNKIKIIKDEITITTKKQKVIKELIKLFDLYRQGGKSAHDILEMINENSLFKDENISKHEIWFPEKSILNLSIFRNKFMESFRLHTTTELKVTSFTEILTAIKESNQQQQSSGIFPLNIQA